MSARRCADVVGSGGSGGTATEGVAEEPRFDDTVLCPDVFRDPVDAGPLVARAGMVAGGGWLQLAVELK